MKRIIYLVVIIFAFSCSQKDNIEDVGSIPFNASIDDKNFNLCNENNIKQYYIRYSSDTPPNYKGEKRGLERSILSKYSFTKSEKENGYVTIRFIVNCEGETGRFRVEEMDFNYKVKEFDNKITNQLLKIVKQLDEWIPRKSNDISFDYYQYLTFKIKRGQIVKILP